MCVGVFILRPFSTEEVMGRGTKFCMQIDQADFTNWIFFLLFALGANKVFIPHGIAKKTKKCSGMNVLMLPVV